MIGDYQKQNIKTALTALDGFCEKEKINLSSNEIKNGFNNIKKHSSFGGRFELISR